MSTILAIMKIPGCCTSRVSATYEINCFPTLQSTLAIMDLAIPDPLLYRTNQRLQGFTPANYPSLYRAAIQYRTGQRLHIPILIHFSLAITDGAKLILLGTYVNCGLNPSVHCFAYFVYFPCFACFSCFSCFSCSG